MTLARYRCDRWQEVRCVLGRVSSWGVWGFEYLITAPCLNLLLALSFTPRHTAADPRDAWPVHVVVPSSSSFASVLLLRRKKVAHSADALLHEGLPVTKSATRPFPLQPEPKYIMRTDVQYTMPSPPLGAASNLAEQDEALGEEPKDLETNLKDPQAGQQLTVELSSDPEARAKQLALLRQYGYDTTSFE